MHHREHAEHCRAGVDRRVELHTLLRQGEIEVLREHPLALRADLGYPRRERQIRIGGRDRALRIEAVRDAIFSQFCIGK